MPASPRRVSVPVAVGTGVAAVTVGGAAPVVVQSMTNTDTADAASTAAQVAALARAGSRAGARHGRTRRGRATAVPEIVERAAQIAGSTCRSSATSTTTGICCSPSTPPAPQRSTSTASIPATSASKQRDEQLRDDRRAGDRARQAGAHRRQLGLARPGPADADDGRERRRRDAAGRAGRATSRRCWRARCARRRWRRRSGSAHDQIIISRQGLGVQDLVDVYRHARRALRLSAAPRAHRGGHGHEGRRRLQRAAWRILLQQGIGDTIRVSLTPEPNGDRTRRGHGRPSRSCSRWACAPSRRRSTPAPGAGARRRPSSRNMASDMQRICATACPRGRRSIRASRD